MIMLTRVLNCGGAQPIRASPTRPPSYCLLGFAIEPEFVLRVNTVGIYRVKFEIFFLITQKILWPTKNEKRGEVTTT